MADLLIRPHNMLTGASADYARRRWQITASPLVDAVDEQLEIGGVVASGTLDDNGEATVHDVEVSPPDTKYTLQIAQVPPIDFAITAPQTRTVGYWAERYAEFLPAPDPADEPVPFRESDKEKLDGIEPQAERNVQADWAEADEHSEAYIANKPGADAFRPREVTEDEAEAGTSVEVLSWSPHRVGQAISALSRGGSGGTVDQDARDAAAENARDIAALDSRLADDEDELASRTHLEKGNGAPDENTPGSRPNDFYLNIDTGKLYQYSTIAARLGRNPWIEIEDFALQADVDAEAAAREAADIALGERIDNLPANTGPTDAEFESLTQRVDTNASKLTDMRTVTQEAWVTADEELVAFADVTGSVQARQRIIAGQLPLNLVWEVSQEFRDQGAGSGDVELVFRVARRASVHRADYRISRGDGPDAPWTRLDSNTIGLFHTDSDYSYWVFGGQTNPTPWANTPPDTVFVMQHHGTATHTRYLGEVPSKQDTLPELGEGQIWRELQGEVVAADLPEGGLTPEQAQAIADNTAGVASLTQEALDEAATRRDADNALGQQITDGLAAKQDTLTLAQKVAVLNVHLDPGVVEQQDPATRTQAITGDYSLVVTAPDYLAGEDVWLQVYGSGQALAGRVKVPTLAVPSWRTPFRITSQQADNIVNNDPGGTSIDIEVRWYSADRDGALVDAAPVGLDIVRTPRVDDKQPLLAELGNNQIWYNAGRGVRPAALPTLIDALRPAGWAQIGAWGSTAGLKDNQVLSVASGGTTIIMRNTMRLPQGVAYNNATGLLTLPLGVWRVTSRAKFAVPGGQRANIKLAQLVDVEGPTAEIEFSASEGYDYRSDPGGSTSLETSAILQVANLGSGNDTSVIRTVASWTGGGVTVNCTSAVLEIERIA